ncbi:MAG: heavy-metal-associated domain-containing protein, partial [Acidobacteriota bacterium]
MNTISFADGVCERHRDRPQPPLARRVAAGRHRFLCRSFSTMSLTSRRRRFVNSTPSRSPQTASYSWSETLKTGERDMETKTFRVPNITCDHCVMTIRRELSELEGVASVQADPHTQGVTVEWDETSLSW